MSDHLSERGALLAQFKEHLARARYNSCVVRRYLGVTSRFLEYLETRHGLIDTVQPLHLTMYVRRELGRFARRHGHPPVNIDHWRALHTVGIHKFLRWVNNGQWPPTATARSPYEAYSQALCAEYAQWLDGYRGFATATICGRVAEARRFLCWYGERNSADSLSTIAISDIDAYVQARAGSLTRVSRSLLATCLRCFLTICS
jgi:integrase/recombinase XerD